MAKAKRKITNAYEAYWFLHDHPKFVLRERTEVNPEEADKLEAGGFLITRDQLVKIEDPSHPQWLGEPTVHTRNGALYAGGKCWREWRHLLRRALEENLDIHYAKTDRPGGHGRVDDDPKKNMNIECWLEFGTVYYGYAYSGGNKPQGEWDTQTARHHGHDYRLDAGGSTFDEALVRLARNVLKHYGDYRPAKGEGRCGKPVCGDCAGT